MHEQEIRSSPTPAEIPAPQNRCERLELAKELFREFHVSCFWHSPYDLEITADLIPFVAKGLRTHGGHRGFALAGKLRPNPLAHRISDQDVLECR
jgi:hypothetical protein